MSGRSKDTHSKESSRSRSRSSSRKRPALSHVKIGTKTIEYGDLLSEELLHAKLARSNERTMDVIDWFGHEDDPNLETVWRTLAPTEVEEYEDCYEESNSDEDDEEPSMDPNVLRRRAQRKEGKKERERAIKASKAHEAELAKSVELERRRQLYGDESIVGVYSNRSPEVEEFIKTHSATKASNNPNSTADEAEEVKQRDDITSALVLPYRSDTVKSASKTADAIAAVRTPLLAALPALPPQLVPLESKTTFEISDNTSLNNITSSTVAAGQSADVSDASAAAVAAAARGIAELYVNAGLEQHARVLPAVLLGEAVPTSTQGPAKSSITTAGAMITSIDSGEPVVAAPPSPTSSTASSASFASASTFYPTDVSHLRVLDENHSLHSFDSFTLAEGNETTTTNDMSKPDMERTESSPPIIVTSPGEHEGRLYLGGWRTSAYVHVKARNIGLIVNAALAIDILAATCHGATWLEDCQRLEASGVKYMRLPWHDTDKQRLWQHKPWDQLTEAVRAVYKSLKSGKNVLVHCRKGRSRSATVVIAYLMARRGFNREEAIRHILNHRPSIAPNNYFLAQLWEFERSKQLLELRIEIGLPKVAETAREQLKRRFPPHDTESNTSSIPEETQSELSKQSSQAESATDAASTEPCSESAIIP